MTILATIKPVYNTSNVAIPAPSYTNVIVVLSNAIIFNVAATTADAKVTVTYI